MKRFWFVLLVLGLMAAVSAQAMAVDVKFSGEYYAAGLYLDKTSLQKNVGPSTAFYFQRLRLNTTFVVAPGLFLTTRADIMERAWGATRSTPNTAVADVLSAGTRAENENIAFDLAHLTYISPIGIFEAGYSTIRAFGTVFGNNSIPAGNIIYIGRMGGFTGAVSVAQLADGSRSAINPSTGSDRDDVDYMMFVKYQWKNAEAGLLFDYERMATYRYLGPGAGILSRTYTLNPYAKIKAGPVALQGEFLYMFGKDESEGPFTDPSADVRQMAGWIDVMADLGMFYAGGTVAYVSGNDPATADKIEGGYLTGGRDWNPCLILFNYDLTYWAGTQSGYSGSVNGSPMTNAWFFQVKGGVKPVDKLDVMASVSYARADKTLLVNSSGRDYGFEVDLSATYKITNNLSYMLGAGYLFTGNYFKGDNDANEVQNDFMVINKLALTF